MSDLLIEKINLGVLSIDEDMSVTYINRYIESHCLISNINAVGSNLFDVFEELPEKWLKRKIKSAFLLDVPVFSCWEQRRFIFKIRNVRPVTTSHEYLAQNVSFIPSYDDSGHRFMCIYIEDMTDVCFYKTQLIKKVAELEFASRLDNLTQIYNRQHWEQQLQDFFAQAKRYKQNLSVVLCDIENLAEQNDVLGHHSGDEILKTVSTLLSKAIRNTDVIGRFGGKAFGVIMPNTCAKGAQKYAQRLLKIIKAKPIHINHEPVNLCFNIGIAHYESEHSRYEDIMTRADMAIYQSKLAGSNVVIQYEI